MTDIIKLLSQDNFIFYSIALAHNLGVYEAILIGELARKWNYWDKQGKLELDGSFFVTQEEIEKDTGLSPYQQRKTIINLIKEGIIETKQSGIPPVTHYKILNNQLCSSLTFKCEETKDLNVKKLNNQLCSFLTFNGEETKDLNVKKLNTTNTISNNTENKKEYTIPEGIVTTPSSSNQDSKEQRLSKAIKEDSKDIGAIFYYIDHLQKSKEFIEALKKWYNAVGKGLRIGQLQMKLDDLYSVFPNEQQQVERINLCYEKSLSGFKFKSDKPETRMASMGVKKKDNTKNIKAFFEEEKRKEEEDNVTFTDFV